MPVAVLDGGELQDGSVYLARPEPLALVPEVEYELEQDGKPVGLFDIKNAGQQDGGWVGFGAWKPLPSAKPNPQPKTWRMFTWTMKTMRKAMSRFCIASIMPTTPLPKAEATAATPAHKASPAIRIGRYCTRRVRQL